jgi:hypothetical protein
MPLFRIWGGFLGKLEEVVQTDEEDLFMFWDAAPYPAPPRQTHFPQKGAPPLIWIIMDQ